MNDITGSIRAEFLRYKALAEGAIAQLRDDELGRADPAVDNSVAVLVTHVSGNLASRFTDFLTSDGEKPWRERENEFAPHQPTRYALLSAWDRGWRILIDTLDALEDADLGRTVTIRGTPFTVHAALHRALAHTSYHVGQIVWIAKHVRGPDWRWLSIPPGQTEAYNRMPAYERPDAHAERLASERRQT